MITVILIYNQFKYPKIMSVKLLITLVFLFSLRLLT
jgi:hypothetical protein